MSNHSLAAAVIAATAIAASPAAIADATCIVSDPNGRIAAMDTPSATGTSSAGSAQAAPLVTTWVTDSKSTQPANWPTTAGGLVIFVR